LQKKKEAEVLQKKNEGELLQKKKEAELLQKKWKEAEALQKKDAEMRKKVAEGRCSYTEKPAGVVSFSFCFYLAFLFDHIILCVLCVSISFCFLILTSNGKK
jgi:hypothetical protein